MKVLVTGGRKYNDYAEVCRTLSQLHNNYGVTLLIHGVDALWHHYDLAAGFKRNSAMLLLNPDYVVAFPGGSGTAMMVKLAENAKLPIERVM
jgi:predicted Rossmann-fold nucleotide-binding protein